jgi:hypothetical protein
VHRFVGLGLGKAQAKEKENRYNKTTRQQEAKLLT